MKRLFVIGGSGLVGSKIIKYAASDYKIHFTYNNTTRNISNTSSTQLDLLKHPSKIFDIMKSFNPDTVIHTVAYRSVDFCEENPKFADILHVERTREIAEFCKVNKTKLVFFSTDAVFKGEMKKKYDENDEPNPLNYYGKTKLRAENVLLNSNTKNLVLRTSVVYGCDKRSIFTNWIIESLLKNQIVEPHVDQYNTPTLVDDLAKATLLCLEKDVKGIFHAAGKTCLNRYDFALKIAKTFDLNLNLIKPATGKQKKQIAPRPSSTCLNSAKIEKLLNFEFSDIEQGISHIFSECKNKVK